LSSIYTAEYRRLIKELVKARKDAELTQANIAKALNRPQSFVSKYERFERRLDMVEFVQIAKLLGADPAKILERL